jgi:hypothetical protein
MRNKMDSTKITLAEVRSRVDPGRSGSFKAKIVGEGNTTQSVYYVSPYGSNTEGAFVAIPEEGTQILVCQPNGSSDWYYLGTTFAPEPKQTTGSSVKDSKLMPIERTDPELYKARGKPMRYLFKSPFGAGITIADEYNPKFINRHLTLTSTRDKRIILHDAPAIDSIILDSGNGSRIILTDDPQNQSLSARAIQVESVGPQKYINTESQTDIVVGKGGRELQVLNNANGVPWGEDEEAGNVNIQSKWKDVNVFSQAKEGRIFIECLNQDGNNQEIVIETNGSDGAITIKTNGNVNIEAGQDINMKAPNVNIGCDKFSVDAGDIQMQGNQVNIDGGEVQLANGASPTEPSIPDPQSTYDNTGVTTY